MAGTTTTTTSMFDLQTLKPPYLTAYVNVSIPPSFQNEAKLFLIQRIRELNGFISKTAKQTQLNHITVPNLDNIHITPHATKDLSAIVFHGMTDSDIRGIAAYIQHQRALFLAEIVPIQANAAPSAAPAAPPTLHVENLYLYFRPHHMKYRLHEHEILILLGLTLLAGIAVMTSPFMSLWTLILFMFLAVAVFTLYFARETVVTPTMSPFYLSRSALHDDHKNADGLIQSCPHDEGALFGGVGGVCT